MPSATFNYTGSYQYWTVPAGVTSVKVGLAGAGSGGRKGGLVSGTLAVTPGSKLCVVVGQAGRPNSGSTGGAKSWGGGGAGGNGNGSNGGDGGGGYTAIRLTSSSGTIKCVAGGAGGTSGDGGDGGLGGNTVGGSGSRGSSGGNSTGAATGGTTSQGGNGGTSSSGSQFNGHDASDTVLDAAAGAGGGTTSNYCVGGGGGGGGYHQGGGGQAASTGYAPGGGGGGGSSYAGALTSTSNSQGGGNATNGGCTITWTTPAPSNQPPRVPSSATINGVTPVDEQLTGSTGTVVIAATISDPDSADTVRLLVRTCTNANFTGYVDHYTGYRDNVAGVVSYTLSGLAQNTRYWVHLYAQDNHGLYSTSYASFNFWTNRAPLQPLLTSPVENARVDGLSSVVFAWTHQDPESNPDDGQYDGQSGFRLQYRTAATPTTQAGPWIRAGGTATESVPGTTAPAHIDGTWTLNPGTFKGNTFYEWQVQTKDTLGHIWGPWSASNSFYVSALVTPPNLLYPLGGALDVSQAQRFSWQFVDPDPGDKQSRADLRYRIVGQPDADWIMLIGTLDPSFPTVLGKPGSQQFWDFPPGTFATGENYEWQVRTYDTIGGGLTPSAWSNSATFWTTGTPGNAVVPTPSTNVAVQGALGCGAYRAFIYVRGGTILVGELDPLTSLTFGRVRDDISTATIVSNGFGVDCGVMYGNLRCWLHELVIFRDGARVWEGPITLLTYEVDQVTIEAKDVMAYAYRRVMRQGYDDSYQKLNPALPDSSTSTDGRPNLVVPLTAVQRAAQILMDNLAAFEPNVLPYLTVIEFPDDAGESRTVPDMAKTAWEEVDDMAATAGIDYTVVGRRIVIWDTNRSIGRLPMMTDGDFSDPPVITEYGMQLCNFMVTSDNSGVFGTAEPDNQDSEFEAYGPIEMVTSAYGETSTAPATVQTPDSIAALQASLTEQAQRNIGNRWPTPVVARVPDNSTLNPEVNLGFDQLVPGVWIPLLAKGTVRVVQQWQKLDSVTVNFQAGVEQIQVVMSPAPNAGQDPDADTGDDDGGDDG